MSWNILGRKTKETGQKYVTVSLYPSVPLIIFRS